MRSYSCEEGGALEAVVAEGTAPTGGASMGM